LGADGSAGVAVSGLGCHDARVTRIGCSAVDGLLARAVGGGLGVARAFAVVRAGSWAVRAWIVRWIAAGFSVG
jgi:hypothetical protein